MIRVASSDAIANSRTTCRPSLECFPFQEVRPDVGLFLYGIIVAKDAIGDQRVAREDRILVQLDRSQADHGGLLAAVPSERGRARPLLASRPPVGEDRALDEALPGPKLPQRLPVHVKRSGKT